VRVSTCNKRERDGEDGKYVSIKRRSIASYHFQTLQKQKRDARGTPQLTCASWKTTSLLLCLAPCIQGMSNPGSLPNFDKNTGALVQTHATCTRVHTGPLLYNSKSFHLTLSLPRLILSMFPSFIFGKI